MSEPMPEGGSAAGGFMTKKFAGIPAIVWLLGAALLAYLYFRNSSSSGSASSTGGGGTSTTGNIHFTAPSTNITVNDQYRPTQNSTHNTTTNNNTPPRHRTHNPQPKPHHRKNRQTHHTTVKHPAKSAAYVTVGKWPGNSSGGVAGWNTTVWGIAHHFHETVAQILKLNPQIKNANLVHPGERVRYR